MNTQIIIEPELLIGTEFWVMSNNKPLLGLIAAYNVHITSYVDNKKGWYDQLWERWQKKTQKSIWKLSYTYEAKLDGSIPTFGVEKKNGVWWLSGERIYFSLDELRQDMI